MKKKGLLIFTFFMLILNTVCFLYVDYAMQQDMSIYVLQVGRYKEKENANQIINSIERIGDDKLFLSRSRVCHYSRYLFRRKTGQSTSKRAFTKRNYMCR